MLMPAQNQVSERERILGDAMRDVASELRLIDAIEFISFVRLEKFAHIENLVNAASELYFRPGSLSFGASAEASVDWGRAPSILLDMEFRHQGLSVYFSLILESLRAAVAINFMTVVPNAANAAENTQRLIEALSEARGLSTANGCGAGTERSHSAG